jgi:hypothetical protein
MRAVRALLPAAVLATAALTIPAGAADPAPVWDTTADAGRLGDELARRVAVSPLGGNVNNPEIVVVSGDATKPAAVRATGVDDIDVATSAYRADTGQRLWSSVFDGSTVPGTDDTLAGLEINANNNLLYEVINSGGRIHYQERALRDGRASGSATHPGSAADTAISEAGGFVGIAGQDAGDFLAVVYQTGLPTFEFAARPTKGRATSADIQTFGGTLDDRRTLLLTGQSSGFGTGGDMYTTAYNYRTRTQLWSRTFASPDNRMEEGLVAEAAHVSDLGRSVAFVAGRRFTPERGFDIVLTAYDLRTGTPLWSGDGGVREFDGGLARGDDSPTHVAYSDATSTVYVAGTSERGTYDQDVIVLAYDATTGALKGTGYARGASANADDAPTGLTVSRDGRQVLVAADVVNRIDGGREQAGLFAFNARLAPGASRLVGGDDRDRSAGLVTTAAADRVVLAGWTTTATAGADHRATAFALVDLPVPPVELATSLAFTPDSATTGQHTDTVTLAARLADETGAALAGRTLTFALAGTTVPATTGGDGTARATFTLSVPPGEHPAKVSYAGEDGYLASAATFTFTVTREDSALTLAVSGAGISRVLSARLSDGDTAASGLAGRLLAFTADGVGLGTATTDGDGVAQLSAPPGFRGGSHTYGVTFAGDDLFLGSAASRTT